MGIPSSFTAVTADWQLTQAVDSEPAATPIVQASLAFAAASATAVADMTWPASESLAEHRGQAEGRWRLTPSIVSESSASPFLQASLAFPAGTGPCIANALRQGSDGIGRRRRLGKGGLRLRPGRSARSILVARVRGGKAEFTVESTLPRAQFDWLLSLVEQPNCSVHLEFELPDPFLMADTNGGSSTELANSRFWVKKTCGAVSADPWPIEAQRLAAQNELIRATERLRDLVAAVRDAIAGPPAAEAATRARIATVAPTRTFAAASAMTEAPFDDLTVLESGTEKPRPTTLPVWAEQCDVIGSTGASTAPAPMRAVDVSEGASLSARLAQQASPSEGSEEAPSVGSEASTPARDSAEEAPALAPGPSVAGAFRAPRTAEWRAATTTSVPQREEDTAAPNLPAPLPASLAGNPRADHRSPPSVAKFTRSRAGLSIAALLVLAVGGYLLSHTTVETTSTSATASVLPLPPAVGQPLSVNLAENSGTAGPSASPAVASADRASSEPAVHAALPVDSGAQHNAATAAHKSPTGTAGQANARERAGGGKRGGTANARKVPPKSQPAPPTTAAVTAAPPIETTAPAPLLPTREAPLVSTPPTARDPCGGLRGLKRAQCQSCEGAGTVSRDRCERSVKISYCRGKWGDTPDCPWFWASGEDTLDAVRP